MKSTPIDYVRLRELLSAERLGSYLRATDDDLVRTFALYEWNIDASAAALSLTAIVEVVVRNALDTQMQAWAGRRSGGDWMDMAPLDDRGQADIRKARARASRGGRQATHGHVVAELSLGFWRYLVSRRYYTSLWVPGLRYAFPGMAGQAEQQRRSIESDLQQLLFLRNRAAHHEPIHRRDLDADLARAIELLGCVDPTAAAWASNREMLSVVIARRPT
ncbi:MAG: hypothetical protein Q4G51_02060 [Dermatophilus congolensis]|nr:hypothetical protein [Dermatophilus congolensis]